MLMVMQEPLQEWTRPGKVVAGGLVQCRALVTDLTGQPLLARMVIDYRPADLT